MPKKAGGQNSKAVAAKAVKQIREIEAKSAAEQAAEGAKWADEAPNICELHSQVDLSPLGVGLQRLRIHPELLLDHALERLDIRLVVIGIFRNRRFKT